MLLLHAVPHAVPIWQSHPCCLLFHLQPEHVPDDTISRLVALCNIVNVGIDTASLSATRSGSGSMAAPLASCSYPTLSCSRTQKLSSGRCFFGSEGRCLNRQPVGRLSRRQPGSIRIQVRMLTSLCVLCSQWQSTWDQSLRPEHTCRLALTSRPSCPSFSRALLLVSNQPASQCLSRPTMCSPLHIAHPSLVVTVSLYCDSQHVSAVIVNLGEGIYTRSQLKAASKGRPSIGILLLSNVALVAVRA